MSIERSKSKDFKSLSASSKGTEKPPGDLPSLRPSGAGNLAEAGEPRDLVNYGYIRETEKRDPPVEQALYADADTISDVNAAEPAASGGPPGGSGASRKERLKEKDKRVLKGDRWLVRHGHFLTFIGLYLFTVMVFFRPYELLPEFRFLVGTAIYFAVATLAIYLPSQLAAEGNLTMLSTEVKAVLAMTAIALLSILIAKDPKLAWAAFNEPFVKAVATFIVLVNVLRTRKRLMGIMWLSLGIGIYLAISAIYLYMTGQSKVEGYRVEVDVGGMFGNPNEMALHFVMMVPLAIALGVAAKSNMMRMIYFILAALFIAGNMVTYSRGGFVGLVVCSFFLAWKLGRKYRLNVTIATVVIGILGFLAAPGNYGLRILSIFVPSLDPVGSNDARRDLLERSLIVSIRQPWGIGIGNFTIVGIRNQETHNAYTQVSSELGVLGLIAYMVFIISPFRKLGAIERTLFRKDELNWFYYMAIGLQASIVGYLVSSFFGSVAYNWFIYYLIAYAVAFRRIYSTENGLTEEVKAEPIWNRGAVEAT